MQVGAYAHAGLLRGVLERGEVRVVGTARLAVVLACAVRFHTCEVHFVAALPQLVDDVPIGPLDLTVAVVVPVGELSRSRVPVGFREHALPVGHVALARAGVGGAILITRVHAHVEAVDAAEGSDALKLDRVHPAKRG
jgi:hypothetical protein